MNLLTTKDAAARLSVTVGRIYQFIAEKRLPARKVGRDYLIDENDLPLVMDRKPGRPKKVTAAKARSHKAAAPKKARRKK